MKWQCCKITPSTQKQFHKNKFSWVPLTNNTTNKINVVTWHQPQSHHHDAVQYHIQNTHNKNNGITKMAPKHSATTTSPTNNIAAVHPQLWHSASLPHKLCYHQCCNYQLQITTTTIINTTPTFVFTIIKSTDTPPIPPTLSLHNPRLRPYQRCFLQCCPLWWWCSSKWSHHSSSKCSTIKEQSSREVHFWRDTKNL